MTTILAFQKLPKTENELGDFSALANKSFEFWNNKKDDIYQISSDENSGTFRNYVH